MAKVIFSNSVEDFVEQAHLSTGIPKERLYFHLGYGLASDPDYSNGFSVSSDALILIDSFCPFFDSEKESE